MNILNVGSSTDTTPKVTSVIKNYNSLVWQDIGKIPSTLTFNFPVMDWKKSIIQIDCAGYYMKDNIPVPLSAVLRSFMNGELVVFTGLPDKQFTANADARINVQILEFV